MGHVCNRHMSRCTEILCESSDCCKLLALSYQVTRPALAVCLIHHVYAAMHMATRAQPWAQVMLLL